MALSYTFYKNDGTSVSEQLPFMPATPFPDPAADFGWSVQGKTFKGWNTESDGSGTFYYTGDTIFTGTTFYAIWEAPVITYLTTDRDLTSIANAIRTKGGTSAQLAFPAGFVSAVEAIPTGGGGSMQSGTMTLAADVPANGNLVVSLSGAITNFVFYVSAFPSSQYPDGWQTVGGVWFNNYAWNFLRYNDVNYTAGQGRTVTATSSSISINLQYKIPAGSTINWFGW